MQRCIRFYSVFCFFVFAGLILSCGSKPKEGKVEVIEQEFSLRQLSDYAYTIDARGKIKNIGETDVKKIVVTGCCKSCSTGMAPGRWTVVDEDERKRSAEEQDVIQYLVAGEEEEFSFTDLAVMYNMVPEPPDSMPEDMEVVILSFSVVQ